MGDLILGVVLQYLVSTSFSCLIFSGCKELRSWHSCCVLGLISEVLYQDGLVVDDNDIGRAMKIIVQSASLRKSFMRGHSA